MLFGRESNVGSNPTDTATEKSLEYSGLFFVCHNWRMAKVTISPAGLQVKLSPLEAFLGLHVSTKASATQVVGAQALGKGWWKILGFRIGIAMPWVMVGGTFLKRREVLFVNWLSGQEVLQINLKGHTYSRIIVGVKDAKALAEEINTAITAC